MNAPSARTAAVRYARAAMDELVKLCQALEQDGRGVRERDEQAAVRLRQALELLEGTGPGGFDRVQEG